MTTPATHAQRDPATLFGRQQQFSAGDQVWSVALASLDRDGTPELAVVNSRSNVSVMLGNGDGSFQTRQDFATGNGPWSVTISDLDGDGPRSVRDTK